MKTRINYRECGLILIQLSINQKQKIIVDINYANNYFGNVGLETVKKIPNVIVLR